MLSHSLQTFIHSWRISPQTFVNSVSNKQCSWTHIALRVQQTRQLPLTKARFGLERQRQTRAVWAKRTEYSIEQIRQSLQRLKIAKIVRMQNLHNFWTIDSVFFPTHACDTSCQSLTHVYRKPIKVGHSSRCALTRLCSWHMSNYSYVVSATCRTQMFPLCYES